MATKNSILGNAQNKNQLLILLFTIPQKNIVAVVSLLDFIYTNCSDRSQQLLPTIVTQDVVVIKIILIVHKKPIISKNPK